MADISSRLPTQDQSDGAVNSAAPSEAILVGGSDGTNLRAISTTSTGSVNIQQQSDFFPASGSITVVDSASTTTTVYGGQVWYIGTPTTGSYVSFSVPSEETIMLKISGTWTGTLQSEVSVDNGTTWIAHSIHLIGSAIFSSSFTENVIGSLNASLKNMYRVRATAAMTGTATIAIGTSINPSSIYVANSIKLVDGSSTLSTTTMNIVAASTAATTANTAVVVALSPSTNPTYNSQLETADIINTSLSSGSITVSTTAVALRVGSSNLTNRKMLMCSPINGVIYIGASSSVTTATGIPVFPNNIISFAFSANVTPYVIAAASTTVNVIEGA